jgi:hypothetical protein
VISYQVIICSHLQATGLTAADIWDDQSDHSLWTAKLFCDVSARPTGSDHGFAGFNVTWLQYVVPGRGPDSCARSLASESDCGMSPLSEDDTTEVSIMTGGVEYFRQCQPYKAGASYVHDNGKATLRYSLSDLLSVGDARRIYHWKLFLRVLNGFDGVANGKVLDNHKDIQLLIRECCTSDANNPEETINEILLSVFDDVVHSIDHVSYLLTAAGTDCSANSYAERFQTSVQYQNELTQSSAAILLGLWCATLCIDDQGSNSTTDPTSGDELVPLVCELVKAMGALRAIDDPGLASSIIVRFRELYRVHSQLNDTSNSSSASSRTAEIGGRTHDLSAGFAAILCPKFLRAIAGTGNGIVVVQALLSFVATSATGLAAENHPRLLILAGWMVNSGGQDSGYQVPFSLRKSVLDKVDSFHNGVNRRFKDFGVFVIQVLLENLQQQQHQDSLHTLQDGNDSFSTGDKVPLCELLEELMQVKSFFNSNLSVTFGSHICAENCVRPCPV